MSDFFANFSGTAVVRGVELSVAGPHVLQQRSQLGLVIDSYQFPRRTSTRLVG